MKPEQHVSEQHVSEQPNMGVMHLSKFLHAGKRGITRGLDKDLCSVEFNKGLRY